MPIPAHVNRFLPQRQAWNGPAHPTLPGGSTDFSSDTPRGWHGAAVGVAGGGDVPRPEGFPLGDFRGAW